METPRKHLEPFGNARETVKVAAILYANYVTIQRRVIMIGENTFQRVNTKNDKLRQIVTNRDKSHICIFFDFNRAKIKIGHLKCPFLQM